MLLTAIAYLLIAALGLVALGTLLAPLALWLWAGDMVDARENARQLQEAEELLAQARDLQRQAGGKPGA